MSNKVQFKRYDRCIPDPENIVGLLEVNDEEDSLEFKSLGELNATFGRDNVVNGMTISRNGNTFTVSKGQALLHTKIGYLIENDVLHVFNNIWGVLSKEQFEGGHEYNNLIKDDSTIEYSITEAHLSEGRVSSNSINPDTSYAPINAFKNDSNDYRSNNTLPVTLTFDIDNNYTHFVTPTSFIIKNSAGDATTPVAAPTKFLIQGSYKINPYNDGDWETIINVTNHPTGASVSKTYTTNTTTMYNHFRLYITEKDGSQDYVAINRFDVIGTTKNDFASDTIYKFLIKDNRDGHTTYVKSFFKTPVWLEGVKDYLPIDKQSLEINDYEDMMFVDSDEDMSITLNDSAVVYLTYEGLSEYIDVDLPYLKLFSYDASSNTYEPLYQKDLGNLYQDRFIVYEQWGSNGFRVYSDGWKEQWGTQSNPTFPITFDEPPYIVPHDATNVTRTGMTVSAGYWEAKGY